MRVRVLAMALAAVFALTFSLRAQKNNEDTNTRSVEGIVTTGGDKPVQGAVVQLKDLKTLQIRSFYTEAGGGYHFAGLSTNVDYELRASHNGVESGSKTLSVFDSKKVATINLKLK